MFGLITGNSHAVKMYRMVPLVVLSLAIVQVCMAEQPLKKVTFSRIIFALVQQFRNCFKDFRNLLSLFVLFHLPT